MPTLELLTGPRAGDRWPVVGERFVLGRVSGCQLVIDCTVAASQPDAEESVSRRHAVISLVDGTWVIEDGDGRGRASYNGTRVNNEWVPHPTRRPLADGDRVRICDVRFLFRLDPPSTFSVEASVSHEDSAVVLAGQPAERLRRLLDISIALRGLLKADDILTLALDHLFRLFPRTDRGLVLFRETPTDELTARASRSADGGRPDPRFSTTVVRDCLTKVEAVLGNDLANQFPNSESVGGLPPSHSLLCTPLWTTTGQALGVIQLDRRADGTKYDPDDLGLLLGVASQVSVALSNARLHQESLDNLRRARDLMVGQQVQRALLPAGMPAVPGYEFAAHYEAALEVGGDYYDFVPLADGRLAVLLGDVEGKGVPAGLVMAKFGVEARVCLESEADPAAAVARLNARMCRGGPAKFVTLAVAVLDPVAHSATVVSAGHPSPLLLRADGSVDELIPDNSGGFMIGMADGAAYESVTVPLRPGDRLLIYSDGVSDAMDAADRRFELDGIRAATDGGAAPARAILDRLLAAVRRHAADCDQFDDITMVCFGRTGD